MVLGDGVIKDILLGLSKDEILSFRDQLEKCLMSISPGTEGDYQPTPGIINRPEGQRCLFRAFTSAEHAGTKIIITPAPNCQQGLHGILVIVDKCGIPVGVLNAEEITGYRTSMSVMIPYYWRRNSENIVIFGAGKQALWHARILLALRGGEVKSISIVNRSADRARELIMSVQGENDRIWKSKCHFNLVSLADVNSESRVEMLLSEADAIFCTVASTRPLFSLDSLKLKSRGHGCLPFISAVGSWQPDMIEIHPDILHHATASKGYSNDGISTGTVIVDDGKNALLHAGEIVQAGLREDQIIDLGKLISWKRSVGRRPTDGIKDWLENGLVVYKSIGVSVTDLAVGNAILDLSAEKKLGTLVNDF